MVTTTERLISSTSGRAVCGSQCVASAYAANVVRRVGVTEETGERLVE